MTHKLRKTHAKTYLACLGSILIPEKYVFRVCFESRFTRMISSLKYKWPPGSARPLSSPIFETFFNFSITLYLYPYQKAPYEAYN